MEQVYEAVTRLDARLDAVRRATNELEAEEAA